MQVNLDIFELGYLLDTCLRGSHLRSSTVTRFVDDWYDGLTDIERVKLFEWAVRLSYAWNKDKPYFEPYPECCGQDTIFMKRYHPLNQYDVFVDIKEHTGNSQYWHTDGHYRAFLMDGEYYIKSNMYIPREYIAKVERIDLSEQWEECKQAGIDYDKNIID